MNDNSVKVVLMELLESIYNEKMNKEKYNEIYKMICEL